MLRCSNEVNNKYLDVENPNARSTLI